MIWSPLYAAEGGTVEYPAGIAKMLNNCPVYLYSCPPKLREKSDTQFIEFKTGGFSEYLLEKSPIKQLYLNMRYATWKPPADFNVFITRGPKAVHTVQRLGQRHIHLFDGSYRGFFFHKDKYNDFQERSVFNQFPLGILRHYFRTAIQASVNTVDHIVVNSEWTADVVKSLFNREADSIIYPAMPVDSYDPSYRDDPDPYYLYLGGVDPHHRVLEVIKAFNNISSELKIVGSGNQIDELQRHAEDNIEFCGYITGKEKRKILANAEALVNPANHSFGRVFVESFASGRPVISLEEGYAPYLITDGESGILYKRGVGNLIKAIKRYEADGITASTGDLIAATEKFRQERQAEKWQQAIFKSSKS